MPVPVEGVRVGISWRESGRQPYYQGGPPRPEPAMSDPDPTLPRCWHCDAVAPCPDPPGWLLTIPAADLGYGVCPACLTAVYGLPDDD